MNKKHLIFLSLLAFLPAHAETTVDQLADKVMQAAGSANWSKVERVQFTFRVVIDGQEKVAAKHDWNVTANTDFVSWSGKTVTVDLGNPGSSEDEKNAFQRWTNDAYWLIAPLKLKDNGTVLTQPAENQLELSFKEVGLTPGDRYLYEIDTQTNLPRAWTYMPNPETKKLATWEKYVTTGGLTLSTYHKMGNVELFIDDLKVTPRP